MSWLLLKEPTPVGFYTSGWTPPVLGWRLVAGGAVDGLAEEVGVPVVPRVLLDHVHEDPADVALALGVVAPAGHDVVERPS